MQPSGPARRAYMDLDGHKAAAIQIVPARTTCGAPLFQPGSEGTFSSRPSQPAGR
jgi:hypothetical protein